MVRGADRMSAELKKIIEQNKVIIAQNEAVIGHLAEISNDLRVFREFVLEVKPNDAREEIESLQ